MPNTGALTISGVLASDADTYTVTATTPIASANGFAAYTSQNTVPLTVITSESANPTSTQFTLNFYGPTGVSYRSLVHNQFQSRWQSSSNRKSRMDAGNQRHLRQRAEFIHGHSGDGPDKVATPLTVP